MMYNQFNRPMSESNLPEGYTINNYDHLHNSIAQLYCMLTELDRVDHKFLSQSIRNDIIKDEIDSWLDCNHSCDSVSDMLRNGCKGYANMTDLELCVEVQGSIAGNCGLGYGDFDGDWSGSDELNLLYRQVKLEVDSAIAELILLSKQS